MLKKFLKFFSPPFWISSTHTHTWEKGTASTGRRRCTHPNCNAYQQLFISSKFRRMCGEVGTSWKTWKAVTLKKLP